MTATLEHPIGSVFDGVIELQQREEFAEPEVAGNPAYAAARDKVFSVSRAIRESLNHVPSDTVSNWGLAQMQSRGATGT